MKNDAALERYFEEAASWDRDRAAMNERSVRIAWRIAIGACALTGMAVAALMMLLPLKRVDPFVIPKPLKGVVPTGHLNSSTLWVEQWRWEN